jgi:hypothetical protein
MNRIILEGDNPLFRKAHPVLMDIFCHGIQSADNIKVNLGALILIGMAPFRWVMMIIGRGIHIVIILAAWWFLKEFIAAYSPLDSFLLAVSIIVVLYKDIYDELMVLLLQFLVLISGGAFLRWVCRGYLSGTGFRQWFFTLKPMESIIGSMVEAIPDEHRLKYTHIMQLYIDSNNEGGKEALELALEKYSHG